MVDKVNLKVTDEEIEIENTEEEITHIAASLIKILKH